MNTGYEYIYELRNDLNNLERRVEELEDQSKKLEKLIAKFEVGRN